LITSFKNIASQSTLQEIGEYLQSQGVEFHSLINQGRTHLITSSDLDPFQKDALSSIATNLEFHSIGTPYQLASKDWKKEPTVIDVNGSLIGGSTSTLIAGPCAVESEEQLFTIAEFLQSRGVRFLRGGAYKPRTSPYTFQGMKSEGLKLLKKVSNTYGMNVVTELMDISYLEEVYDYADVIQIGTRNMFNYKLLKELGKIDKPIMLKRGFSAKIEEWLQAAEYVLLGGNEKVILCERGIRTFEPDTRNTLDLGALSLVKELSHLPILSDPSQGTGKRSLVEPMTLASIAAGADGVMIETHHDPEHALSDGEQSLNFNQFDELLLKLRSTFSEKFVSFDFEKNSVNFTTVK